MCHVVRLSVTRVQSSRFSLVQRRDGTEGWCCFDEETGRLCCAAPCEGRRDPSAPLLGTVQISNDTVVSS
ncbi:hypothetical protein GJAV_G00050320 [Gymnothorax javanicus]|nr:hypothetical protein GJAV_G00050320 [Gymnothorax javanicus]